MEFVMTFLVVYVFCASRADARAQAGGGVGTGFGSAGATSNSYYASSLLPTSSGYGGYGGVSTTAIGSGGVGGSGVATAVGGYRASTTYNSQPTVINVASARPDPIMVGAAYAGCLLAWRGCINPARALGAAFVATSFASHWVFWVGPLLGAVTGAFTFEYIFSGARRRSFAWDATTTTTF